MSSSPMSPVARRTDWPRILFWLLCVAATVVGVQFFLRMVANYMHFDAKHYREHWLERWWLVAHLSGGSVALLLGPFQFSGWLRRRSIRAHRWMGRLYLGGVLLGSMAAVYLGMHAQVRGFGIGLLYLDVAWVVTTGMGYLAVLRRQFTAHREWMIRSYVVTFAFVMFRVMGVDLKLYRGLSLEGQLTMLSWLCWAIPLLLTEVVLQWRRTVGPAR